jgi:YfiH family protein
LFSFAQKGRLRYLQSDLLNIFEYVTHAFLTRWGGVSTGEFSDLNFSVAVGDSPSQVNRNLEIVGEQFECLRMFTMQQVHGNRVLVLRNNEDFSKGPPQADAVITAQQGIGLGIKTADCVPIMILDPVRKVIGAVHAGWRSTSLRIGPESVATFASEFSSKPSDLVAVIGPCIGPCCYEVDGRVFDSMSEADRRIGFRPISPDRWMLDLAAVNRSQLIEAGLITDHIAVADQCTACRRDLFFSHRGKGGKTGRQLNFIMLNHRQNVLDMPLEVIY